MSQNVSTKTWKIERASEAEKERPFVCGFKKDFEKADADLV